MILKGLSSYRRRSLRSAPRTFVAQLVMASWPRDFVAGSAEFVGTRSIPSFFMRLRRVLG